jgi:hypothetical protein
MEKPTFENFVQFEKQVPDSEEDNNSSRVYSLYGILDKTQPNSIYLWRNYNTFDEEPTTIPEGFKFIHNGYDDCEMCNELNMACPEDIEKRKEQIQDYRFGTKVFAEDYIPQVVNRSGEVFFTHDNGGRPFKVYIDENMKEMHIYSLNRNIIFSKKSESNDYTHTNVVMFTEPTSFQLAMNAKCSDCSNESTPPTGCVRAVPESSESSSGESSGGSALSLDDPLKMNPFYDQHIATYKYEKVWIPDGVYLTRDNEGNVVPDTCSSFYGNSILAYVGKTEDGLNRYISVGSSVNEFVTDDEIQRYYSTVGNSDVPYPVAIGNKYVYFMLDLDAEPIEKYANLTEEQLSDAYMYYYGHICLNCHGSDCDCKIPEYKSVNVSSREICKRDF